MIIYPYMIMNILDFFCYRMKRLQFIKMELV